MEDYLPSQRSETRAAIISGHAPSDPSSPDAHYSDMGQWAGDIGERSSAVHGARSERAWRVRRGKGEDTGQRTGTRATGTGTETRQRWQRHSKSTGKDMDKDMVAAQIKLSHSDLQVGDGPHYIQNPKQTPTPATTSKHALLPAFPHSRTSSCIPALLSAFLNPSVMLCSPTSTVRHGDM
jgi:hypothetical protein